MQNSCAEDEVLRMKKDRESAVPQCKEITPNNFISPHEVISRVESPPPRYDSLSAAEVRLSTSPNRKWMFLAVGVSLAVVVLVGIVVGIAVYTTGE